MNHISEKYAQRWSKFIQQSPFKKYGEQPRVNATTIISNTDEKTTENVPVDTPKKNTAVKEESGTLHWLSMTFCGFFSSSSISSPHSKTTNNNEDKEYSERYVSHVSSTTASSSAETTATTTSNSAGYILPPNKANKQHELEKKASCSSITSNNHSSSHEKDIVPLKQFLRYSMKRSDRRAFKRRRVTQPFKPRYEIEWQKDQWLQLDNATNQQIEQLRKSGFSKIAIRNDQCLKKYIAYDNASDMDILLELTLDGNDLGSKNRTVHEGQPEPILCHQPSHFSVRRTHWWHTSHRVGEAHLPSWVDPDLCCKSVMMDARSVMDTVTNFNSRRPSLASVATPPVNNNSRYPDTPALSTRSSINHLRTSSSTYSIKPLKYSEPAFIMEESAFSAIA